MWQTYTPTCRCCCCCCCSIHLDPAHQRQETTASKASTHSFRVCLFVKLPSCIYFHSIHCTLRDISEFLHIKCENTVRFGVVASANWSKWATFQLGSFYRFFCYLLSFMSFMFVSLLFFAPFQKLWNIFNKTPEFTTQLNEHPPCILNSQQISCKQIRHRW